MNDYKIAILITTFLRDALLYKTLQTIVNNFPSDCIVLIADQGYASSEKDIQLDYFKSQISLEYYKIPFDSGLSAGRNFLVNKAKEMNIPFCLVSADSIQFTTIYDFKSIINFLESQNNYGVVGFELLNSKCNWEFYLKIENNKLYYIESEDYITYNDIKFKQIDICRNIFLTKTEAIYNLWDEEMKLSEHTLAFWELKSKNYKVFWTDYCVFKRFSSRYSSEYDSYRNRVNDFMQLAMSKMNIKQKIFSKKK